MQLRRGLLLNAARRNHKRRDFPRGLYEPRPGYFVWRAPDGKTHVIGRVPYAHARAEAIAANAYVAEQKPSLVERLQGGGHTMADLLAEMRPAQAANTAKTWKALDKHIAAAMGTVACSRLTVADCAKPIEALAAAGKARQAEALRSRLIAVCKRGQSLGWMHANPAEATERPQVVVKRGRLTLEMFQAIHARAGEVAEWLPRAMMLALVTGQDRSTIVEMQFGHVADGYLTTWRSKTKGTNQPVAIPTTLRLEAVGVTLADLLRRDTGVVTRYIVHHVSPWGNAPAGSKVHPDRVSHAFTEARVLAGIPDVGPDGKLAPTFHELRSLSKRLYDEQGDVDTRALLGHATARMGALYANPRGVEPIKVRVGRKA